MRYRISLLVAALVAALSSPVAVLIESILTFIGAPGTAGDAMTWWHDWLPSIRTAAIVYASSYEGWALTAAGIAGLVWLAWMDARSRLSPKPRNEVIENIASGLRIIYSDELASPWGTKYRLPY